MSLTVVVQWKAISCPRNRSRPEAVNLASWHDCCRYMSFWCMRITSCSGQSVETNAYSGLSEGSPRYHLVLPELGVMLWYLYLFLFRSLS